MFRVCCQFEAVEHAAYAAVVAQLEHVAGKPPTARWEDGGLRGVRFEYADFFEAAKVRKACSLIPGVVAFLREP